MPLQRIPGAMVSDATITQEDIGGSLIRFATPQATTSGVSKEFLSIPPWAQRVTLYLQSVSLDGISNIAVQIGSGGSPKTTDYVGHSVFTTVSSVTRITFASSIPILNNNSNKVHFGCVTFTNLSGNIWVAAGQTVTSGTPGAIASGGVVELDGVLDNLRIGSANGTTQFSQGSVNISWE